jgi:hypothetical protein
VSQKLYGKWVRAERRFIYYVKVNGIVVMSFSGGTLADSRYKVFSK